MKLLLASKSNIKEEAIKKWCKQVLKKNPVIEKVEVFNKIIPEQPMNDGIEKTCNERISFVENNYSDIVLLNDYIISIENGLEIKDNIITDLVYIKIKNTITKREFHAKGGNINIDFKILDTYPKIINAINDLVTDYELYNKKYIYDGCKSTLGSLINKYYPDIPANNWMKIIFNKDRKLQIYDVLVEISDYNKSEFI